MTHWLGVSRDFRQPEQLCWVSGRAGEQKFIFANVFLGVECGRTNCYGLNYSLAVF
jgi:hypothetical protein